MKEVVLDTETTGLSVKDGHRIVEIGCIELDNQIPTKKIFHEYLNPQRAVSEDAYKVHGYSDDFLSDKKKFNEIVENFLNFINKKNYILVFVDSNKKEIQKRLKKRANYNPVILNKLKKRVGTNLKIVEKFRKLQLPVEFKKKQSDFIIKNNFKINSVKKDAKSLVKKILLNV